MMAKQELDLNAVRRTLEEEQESIKRRMDSLNLQRKQQNRNLDRGDLAQSYTQLEQDTILADSEQERLSQIETALEKLDNGRYELCDHCGQPIETGRLEVLPYATLCIRCQSEAV
jgi:DnaK suppressor protein